MNTKYAAYLFLLSVSLSAPETDLATAATTQDNAVTAQLKNLSIKTTAESTVKPCLEQAARSSISSASSSSAEFPSFASHRQGSLSFSSWGSPSSSSSNVRRLGSLSSSSSDVRRLGSPESFWNAPGSPTIFDLRPETPSPFDPVEVQGFINDLPRPDPEGFLKKPVFTGLKAPHSTPVKPKEEEVTVDEDSDGETIAEALFRIQQEQELTLSRSQVLDQYTSVHQINKKIKQLKKTIASLNPHLYKLNSILESRVAPTLNINEWMQAILKHRKLINEEGLTYNSKFKYHNYKRSYAYQAIATAYLIRNLLDLKVRLENCNRQPSWMSH